ncbi:glycoside hydrolase family 63 protein [Xylogone sp. PMI_703]|nr:glycoside hydrolase family 63 protein [Xylogone sp. PMI_703]
MMFPNAPRSVAIVAAALSCLTGAVRGADEDPSILISEIGRASNQSLVWGPYRPNLYFGVRPRIPKSLMGALMWAKVDNYQDVQNNFRHTCEQHDGMNGYGWEEFDARKGGVQTIYDPNNFIDIKTFFVKVPGGSHGGSWAVRVRGNARKDAPENLKTTVVFHATLEGLGSLEVDEVEPLGYVDDVTLNGESEGLGKYTLTVTKGRGFHPGPGHPSYDEKPLDRTIVNSFTVPEEYLWQSKALMFQLLKQQIDEYLEKYGDENAPPPWQVYTVKNSPGAGNMHMIQKVFEGDFEFDVIFSSGSAEREITSQDVSKYMASNHQSYGEKFVTVFDPQPPFGGELLQRFTSSMFSNLLGGLGYFYGDELVDRSYAPEYDEENEGFWEEAAEARARHPAKPEGPYELFTTVPSRPFFPRGFLWDEGFHLLPVADWDMDLALEVVKSWYNLMDEDGWIGREQILGNEARSKVPPEFQAQYPHYANPPTLFFILEDFIEKLGARNGTKPPPKEKLSQSESLYSAHLDHPEVAIQYLQNLYPLLKKQFYWFRKTQAGDIKSYDRVAYSSKEAYRWRGRTPMHILTSGLDDYPRPQPPHPGELHVDLMSWMGMMTRSLKDIAGFLDIKEDVAELSAIETAILRNLDDLHWSDKEKTYCDATIDDYEEHVLVCHKGYITIFPFLLGLLDAKDEKLGHILDLIGSEEELWSDFGIRSLSKKDEFYGTAENYWRGPIWININYLAVTQLLNYAKAPGPHQEKAKDLYIRLRMNLVKTIYESWAETNFAWEQYNPETGKGQRTAHFTGWTSLVVKIMNLEDLSDGEYTMEQPGVPKRDEL